MSKMNTNNINEENYPIRGGLYAKNVDKVEVQTTSTNNHTLYMSKRRSYQINKEKEKEKEKEKASTEIRTSKEKYSKTIKTENESDTQNTQQNPKNQSETNPNSYKSSYQRSYNTSYVPRSKRTVEVITKEVQSTTSTASNKVPLPNENLRNIKINSRTNSKGKKYTSEEEISKIILIQRWWRNIYNSKYNEIYKEEKGGKIFVNNNRSVRINDYMGGTSDSGNEYPQPSVTVITRNGQKITESAIATGRSKYIIETKKIEVFKKTNRNRNDLRNRSSNISRAELKARMADIWSEENSCSTVESLCYFGEENNRSSISKNEIIEEYEEEISELKKVLTQKEREITEYVNELNNTNNVIRNKKDYSNMDLEQDGHDLQIISTKSWKDAIVPTPVNELFVESYVKETPLLMQHVENLLIIGEVNEINEESQVSQSQMTDSERWSNGLHRQNVNGLEIISDERRVLEVQNVNELGITAICLKPENCCQHLENLTIFGVERDESINNELCTIQEVEGLSIVVPKKLPHEKEPLIPIIQELDGLEILNGPKPENSVQKLGNLHIENKDNNINNNNINNNNNVENAKTYENENENLRVEYVDNMEISRDYDMLLVKPTWNSLQVQGSGLNLLAVPRDMGLENQEVDDFIILGREKPELLIDYLDSFTFQNSDIAKPIRIYLPLAENQMQALESFQFVSRRAVKDFNTVNCAENVDELNVSKAYSAKVLVPLFDNLEIESIQLTIVGNPNNNNDNDNDKNVQNVIVSEEKYEEEKIKIKNDVDVLKEKNNQNQSNQNKNSWNEINQPIKTTRLLIKSNVSGSGNGSGNGNITSTTWTSLISPIKTTKLFINGVSVQEHKELAVENSSFLLKGKESNIRESNINQDNKDTTSEVSQPFRQSDAKQEFAECHSDYFIQAKYDQRQKDDNENNNNENNNNENNNENNNTQEYDFNNFDVYIPASYDRVEKNFRESLMEEKKENDINIEDTKPEEGGLRGQNNKKIEDYDVEKCLENFIPASYDRPENKNEVIEEDNDKDKNKEQVKEFIVEPSLAEGFSIQGEIKDNDQDEKNKIKINWNFENKPMRNKAINILGLKIQSNNDNDNNNPQEIPKEDYEEIIEEQMSIERAYDKITNTDNNDNNNNNNNPQEISKEDYKEIIEEQLSIERAYDKITNTDNNDNNNNNNNTQEIPKEDYKESIENQMSIERAYDKITNTNNINNNNNININNSTQNKQDHFLNWNNDNVIIREEDINILRENIRRSIYAQEAIKSINIYGTKPKKINWNPINKAQRNTKFFVGGTKKIWKLGVGKGGNFFIRTTNTLEDETLINDDYNCNELNAPMLKRGIKAFIYRVKDDEEEEKASSSSSEYDALKNIKVQSKQMTKLKAGVYKKSIESLKAKGKLIDYIPKQAVGIDQNIKKVYVKLNMPAYTTSLKGQISANKVEVEPTDQQGNKFMSAVAAASSSSKVAVNQNKISNNFSTSNLINNNIDNNLNGNINANVYENKVVYSGYENSPNIQGNLINAVSEYNVVTGQNQEGLQGLNLGDAANNMKLVYMTYGNVDASSNNQNLSNNQNNIGLNLNNNGEFNISNQGQEYKYSYVQSSNNQIQGYPNDFYLKNGQ